MNNRLSVRLLRGPALPPKYLKPPPVTVKCTDPTVLGIRHVIRNWWLIEMIRECGR